MVISKNNKEIVYLVDGSGYIFRAYFAIRHLQSKKGIPTNAVYGFTNMMLKLLRDHNPKFIGVAFDTKAPTFRHDLYKEYKANRPEPPKDLIPQFSLIHKIVDALNLKRLIMPGYEADDIIGTLAKKATEQGYEVVIVTGDKDLMQLVNKSVYLLDELRAARSGKEEYIDEDGVKEKLGVNVEYVTDLLALAGDSSDNIPGVRGIGQKTAKDLINEFGPVEKIYEMLPLIRQNARKQKLRDGYENALLSKQLVTINTDAPVSCDIRDLKYPGLNKEECKKLFEELDFNRLLKDKKIFGDDYVDTNKDQQNKAINKQINHENEKDISNSSSESEPNKQKAHIDKSLYKCITKTNDLTSLITELLDVSHIAIDTETDSLDSMRAKLIGIAIAWGINKAAYIPIGHDKEIAPDQLCLDEVRESLNKVLCDPDKKIIAQNAKYDYKVLHRHGFTSFSISGDPMLASYLLYQDQRKHNLNALSKQHLDHDPIAYTDVVGDKTAHPSFTSVSLDKATVYACEDSDLAFRLDNHLREHLKKENLLGVYEDIELRIEEVLSKMELIGVSIDKNALESLKENLDNRLAEISKKAFECAGGTFNLQSPKQVSEILFEKLKLKVIRKTKSGYSTDSYVLEKLKDSHPLPALLLKHRMLSKLINTYIDTLPLLINEHTGRIHTNYNQFVTATGRLSSSNPNLQNIPIRTPEGRMIRKAFIARPGYVLISLDYSQVELRLLAYASKDPVLLDAFNKDEDVHKRCASEIFEIKQDEVSKEQRTIAKTINFGLLYGMGALRLSQTLNISRADASAYLKKYFERYAGILSWKENLLKDAQKTQEVRTFYGRKRYLNELSSQNAGIRSRGERIAINTPIQGSAADIIKLAMIKTDSYLQKHYNEGHLIMQVHDELVIEAKENDAKTIAKEVAHIMNTCHGLDIDLKVEYGIGKNWNDAH